MLLGSMRMSALQLAAQEANLECAALLLTHGADPHVKNARGQSPLHLAALAQSPETVELLLAKGTFNYVQRLNLVNFPASCVLAFFHVCFHSYSMLD